MKGQVSNPKSMHIQKKFSSVYEHSRFLNASAFEESKPYTTCSKESVRKVTQFGTKDVKTNTHFVNVRDKLSLIDYNTRMNSRQVKLTLTYFSTSVRNDIEG